MLITNIGELVTNAPRDAVSVAAPGPFESLSAAAIVLDGGLVAWTGPASQAPAADEMVDAAGRAVLPGFVDSHAHLVFAGERGLPYSAGGIRSTVAATRAASDEQLRANLATLAAEMLAQGTTTFECKSGYGLTVADEARSLAVAGEVTPEVTYLGAHVVPPEYEGNVAGYVDVVCGEMLAACAPLAKWVDVFCEQGAFGADEARAVLAAGETAGLEPRIHANQLGPGPGVQVAVEAGAASADHCTFLTDADIDALASSGCGVFHPPAVPGRPAAARRRRDSRDRDRLQSGIQLHLKHAAVRGARGPGDAADHPGSGLGRDRRRRARAAPHRRGPPRRRRPRRRGHAGRAVARLPGLPSRCSVGSWGVAVRRKCARVAIGGKTEIT